MKLIATTTLAFLAIVTSALPHQARQTCGGQNDNQTGIGNGDSPDIDNGGQNGDQNSSQGQTLVLFEVGGVPGNECLTFRNNGEIVDAACVNEAADRQVTPATINGQDVLRVQRTFSAGFRPDLVDVDVCVGVNGDSQFRAEDCNSPGFQPVAFVNGQLRATGGACASGHDDLAQMTVDPAGSDCATYTPTEVQPAVV